MMTAAMKLMRCRQKISVAVYSGPEPLTQRVQGRKVRKENIVNFCGLCAFVAFALFLCVELRNLKQLVRQTNINNVNSGVFNETRV